MKNKIVVILLALGASALLSVAQDAGPRDGDRPRREGPGPRDGAGAEGQRPPPPLIAALDANHDGVIDEKEISNAAAALKTLDKNGDGKLTREELRPRPPQGEGQGDRRGPQGRRPGANRPQGPDGERPNRPDAN